MTGGPEFDGVIHPLNRLQICALLSPVESLSFAVVRDALGVSDSVLSKQIKILQDAGYVSVRKETYDSRVRAWLALTAEGRSAFSDHLTRLRQLVDQAGPGQPTDLTS
jgi:DNA-binding MarR family transcriptional regulator